MHARLIQTETLHEIAMAIGTSLDERTMLDACVPLFLRRLTCTSIAVLRVEADTHEIVMALPRSAPLGPLAEELAAAARRPEPLQPPESPPGRVLHVWRLRDFGVLVLGRATPLPELVVRELGPLMDRLSVALCACRQYAELRRTREELLATERRWNLALEAAGHGVWDWSPATNQVFKSATWHALLGCSPAEVDDSLESWSSRVHPDDLPNVYALLEAHLQGRTPVYRSVHRMRRREGSWLWVLDQGMVVSRDAAGAPTRVIGTITDHSLQKHLETDLLEARDAARASSVAKGEFLANMSHEIRTPMNGVLGMTDLILGTELTAEQREYFRLVKSSADHLLTVINDILDYSRVEAGRLEVKPEPIQPGRLLDDTLRTLHIQALEKGLYLELSASPGVPALVALDPARLRQIVVNLVGNAVKFTERGGVLVRLGWVSSPHPLLEVLVEDSGIGISAEHQEHIFEPFSQGDGSITRRYGGTGLGLSISRRLAELMGGSLTVESTPGVGSRFHLRVAAPPLTQDFAPVAAPARAAPTPTASLRVLVAEDNPINQALARRLLEKRGHHVTTVETGRAALEALRRTRFDLVLMDVMMPEMDGLEATRRLRSHEAAGGEHTPVLAVTAAAMAGDRERCLAAGMDGYVAKPIDPRHFDAEIARVLPLRRAPSPPNAAFDRLAALARLENDTELLDALLRDASDDVARLLRELDQAWMRGDPVATGVAAHTLRGVFDIFHAVAAADARALEQACQERRLGDIPALIDALRAAARAFTVEVHRTATG